MSDRLFTQKRQNLQKIAWSGAAVLAVLLIIYALLPHPERPPSRMEISLEDAREKAAWLALPEAPAPSETVLTRARFGKELFFDRRLSADGSKACADCHSFDGRFSSDGDAEWDPPLLVDLHLEHWFFHDGRQDSLLGAVLESLEAPDALDSNRSHIARLIKDQYADLYTQTFGEFPDLSRAPKDAYPNPVVRASLPMEAASLALESLGNSETLEEILRAARETYSVPAAELAKRADSGAKPNKQWIHNHASLTAAEKTAITKVFTNAGRAIAAYLSTVRSTPSAFDQFAARAQKANTLATALDETFNKKALQGFAFFAGEGGCTHCHNGPRLSDHNFHNTGLPSTHNAVDLGRTTGILKLTAGPYHCRAPLLNQAPATSIGCRESAFLIPDAEPHIGAFKTPSLRHINTTAPYMHDGRYDNLSDVLEYYSTLPGKPAVGKRSPLVQRLEIRSDEETALIAFLEALSSEIVELDGQAFTHSLSQKP